MAASAESDIIPKFSGLSLSLPKANTSRDNLLDSDHETMDRAILKIFASYDILRNPPPLDSLLSNIINVDKRLTKTSSPEAAAFLSKYPDLEKVLQSSWDARSFKEVRQLGMCSRLNSSELRPLVTVFDKKSFGHLTPMLGRLKPTSVRSDP